MFVLKFGGSSVSSAERIDNVINIVRSYKDSGKKVTLVVSALGGITDLLVKMGTLASQGDISYQDSYNEYVQRHTDTIKTLFKSTTQNNILKQLNENHQTLKDILHGVFLVMEASSRTMDYILSFGERNSAIIISSALVYNKIDAEYLDARQVIKTNKDFGKAKVDYDLSFQRIREFYKYRDTCIVVVTGFISSAKGGLTTTLGRGGSDYTASIIGVALNAAQIEIWTDVDGVLTADPRKVKKVFTIPYMTYAEAAEISNFGAKVIYPPTIQPAAEKKIPIYIKNSFNPDHKGTLIGHEKDPNDKPVKGISSLNQISLITLQGSGMFGVPGIAARLFRCLASANINIILISQGSSEHSISFAIQPSYISQAQELIQKEFENEQVQGLIEPLIVENQKSVIAIIGENMKFTPGIAGKMLTTLGKNGINADAIAQGSSELNISVVIKSEDESKALNALHQSFFLSENKTINIFMIGLGLIGKTLLKQIHQQSTFLFSKRNLDIKITGISNTTKMLFDEEGINIGSWQTDLDEQGTKASLPAFIKKMKSLNFPNTIFVDNTASHKVAELYESILDSNISISTPNKISTSSSYTDYTNLHKLAQRKNAHFRYETNVGAGLPVISSIHNLIDSGDSIISIEGVLSGSLSFIFNNFDGTEPFSAIVKKAQALGYTEPDPRIDLSGQDIQRKLIILARESGYETEASDIEIFPVLPEECTNAPDVHSFFDTLKKYDAHFEKMIKDALQKGKKLRCIASLEGGKGKIELKEVDASNPFYFLNGSDNMIVFTSERYKERPLVIQGPGAGAEVTAAGIFAEIISIASLMTK